jgi:hypothetical protein
VALAAGVADRAAATEALEAARKQTVARRRAMVASCIGQLEVLGNAPSTAPDADPFRSAAGTARGNLEHAANHFEAQSLEPMGSATADAAQGRRAVRRGHAARRVAR